jgi:hypothetical protein
MHSSPDSSDFVSTDAASWKQHSHFHHQNDSPSAQALFKADGTLDDWSNDLYANHGLSRPTPDDVFSEFIQEDAFECVCSSHIRFLQSQLC